MRPAYRHGYHLYGLCLRSEWPLPYPQASALSLGEVGLLRGSVARLAAAVDEARAVADETKWSRGVALGDGQTYVRWAGRFEFLVSADGREVIGRPLDREPGEAFHTYLLGQALSFALIKQGFDPLHATAVTIDGVAIAFLGESGYGKSGLAGAFLKAGHRLLTDDLLVLETGPDGFVAQPGPPRIKLFPRMARHSFGAAGRGTRIAKTTPKLVIPLGDRHAPRTAAPVKALYALVAPGRLDGRVVIRRLSKRQACFSLLRNAFNTALTDPERLGRQFEFASSVAAAVPIKLLAYPRTLAALPAVREAILADLARA
jgi:hypothetical protein